MLEGRPKVDRSVATWERSTERSLDQQLVEHLKQKGILQLTENGLLVDRDSLQSIALKRDLGEVLKGRAADRLSVFIKVLQNKTAIDLQSLESEEGIAKEIQLIAVPPTIDHLLDQNYPRVAKEAAVRPWEIKGSPVNHEITLPSGEKVNIAELEFAYLFFDSEKVRQLDDGGYEMNIKGQWRDFVFSAFCEEYGYQRNFTIEPGEYISTYNPTTYIIKILANFYSRGILKIDDINRRGSQLEAHNYGFPMKELPANGLLQFVGPGGYSLSYYVGKSNNEHLSFDRNLNPKDISGIKQISRDKVGIFVKGRLAYTFDLLSAEEASELRATKEIALEQRGKAVTEGAISALATVSADDVKKTMRHYDVRDYLVPLPRESDDTYEARIANYQNPDKVLEKLQSFFAEQNISMVELPWEEQLFLAQTVDKFEKQQLSGWLKQLGNDYGIEGIRTFLALEIDSESFVTLYRILNSPDLKPLVPDIFAKFNQIIDQADKAAKTAYHKYVLPQTERRRIKINLLQRATDFLRQLSNKIRPDQVYSLLDNYRQEVAGMAAFYRVIRPDTIEEIGLEIKVKKGNELTLDEKQQLSALNQRVLEVDPDHSGELGRKLGEDLDGLFEKGCNDCEFHILRTSQHIIGFLYFKPMGNHTLYATSFRMRDEAQSAGLAKPMLEGTILSKNRDFNIKAHALGHIPIFKKYLELGFIDEGPEDDYLGSGVTYRKLFMPKREV